MNIEITKKCFDILFKENHIVMQESSELATKKNFINNDIGQKGTSVFNHVSRVSQFYLYDINL